MAGADHHGGQGIHISTCRNPPQLLLGGKIFGDHDRSVGEHRDTGGPGVPETRPQLVAERHQRHDRNSHRIEERGQRVGKVVDDRAAAHGLVERRRLRIQPFDPVHHELGHLYYDLAYRKQPFFFRNGANDGFHEAIGDAIALSVTPEYLKQIGLIQQIPPESADLPILLHTALDKIAFLPFGLLIDKWRWEVFSGQVKPADYEKAWWSLREKYQGVAPPVDRTEADFDPGAKYHIPANTPYARYFLARIYQFQFYRAMCRAAGYTGPLNRCSFYGSKAAGDKLEAMLAAGASKPWQETLKAMTGEDHIDASAMVEYFQPLLTWLKEQNASEKPGWTVGADPLKAH